LVPAVVVTAALALIVGASSARAVSPGTNGVIAFVNSPALAVINPDGTGLNPNLLTLAGGLQPHNPDFSPDGSRLAFDASGKIWVANADGTGALQVPGTAGWATDPSWGPNGQRLVYESQQFVGFGLGMGSIMAIDADGASPQTILAATATEQYNEPAWSPNGKEIALELDSTVAPFFNSIALIRANGSGLQRIDSVEHSGQDAAPNWSPNGIQIVFTRSSGAVSDIYRVNAHGVGNETNLTPQHNDFWKHPTWSPDGTLIAATNENPTWELWTFSPATGFGPAARQVTDLNNAEMPTWRNVGLNTPVGTDVSVSPVDSKTGTSPVSITFGSVKQAGSTFLSTATSGPPAPNGFTMFDPPNAVYYDVVTTAVFAQAVVCIFNPLIDDQTKLIHYVDGVVPGVNVTAPGFPDLSRQEICSIPLDSLSPFLLVTAPDTTPPSIAVSHVADGLNGWNVHAPVALSIVASDASGLKGVPTCSEASPISGEGVHVVTCSVTDNAGNSASATDTVKIDTQAPQVVYTGNLGTYASGQAVSITCSAADASPGSGLASSSGCTDINGTFAPGTHTFSATATDVAGNSGAASVTFTVSAPVGTTPQALCVLTKQYVQSSANYRALPPAWRAFVDALATAVCRNAGTVKPAQVPAWAAAYRTGVAGLVRLGWLTPAQGASLIALSRTL
jgi:hypothetical protein